MSLNTIEVYALGIVIGVFVVIVLFSYLAYRLRKALSKRFLYIERNPS